jgi:hypothetical protein
MIKRVGLAALIAVSMMGSLPEGRAFDTQSATDELAQILREARCSRHVANVTILLQKSKIEHPKNLAEADQHHYGGP